MKLLGTPLFRRHYFISLTVIVVGLAFSVGLSMVVLSMLREEQRFRSPGHMIRHVIKHSQRPAKEFVDSLKNDPQIMPFDVSLIDSESPQIQALTDEEKQSLADGEEVRLRPNEAGPPHGEILALPQGEGYLIVGPRDRLGPGGPQAGPPIFPVVVTVICLFASVVITTGIAMFILFSSYRRRANIAAKILQELKNGNLSARLPIEKMDELASLVGSFNHMADEIENLVKRIRATEAARMEMLQSLAHDLRTPIASMQTLLESLHDDRQGMTHAQIQRSLDLCLIETSYFGKLVEDLLTLASLAEPKYSKNADRIALADFVREIARTALDEPAISSSPDANIEFVGDRKLLERLFRNAMDNAQSFAQSRVHLSMRKDGSVFEIIVDDDGPGFSEEALKEFGQRRRSRRVLQTHGHRVSSGIGSVIMKEVIDLHGGTLKAENRSDQSGARITIRLPVA